MSLKSNLSRQEITLSLEDHVGDIDPIFPEVMGRISSRETLSGDLVILFSLEMMNRMAQIELRRGRALVRRYGL
jgi:hypothetical protein